MVKKVAAATFSIIVKRQIRPGRLGSDLLLGSSNSGPRGWTPVLRKGAGRLAMKWPWMAARRKSGYRPTTMRDWLALIAKWCGRKVQETSMSVSLDKFSNILGSARGA